jgi:demethylmenaquinone methyltransferase/2-methoxy-6-polyprenyl-1,4-benzoquinol methylase
MSQDIHDPAFVAALFDRCSTRYRWWSAIASFGFVDRWRRDCVGRLIGQRNIGRIVKGEVGGKPFPAPQIVDLMAGSGEGWPYLLDAMPKARINAIDISQAMHARAQQRLHGTARGRISHTLADALDTKLQPEYADLVISNFGLKTLNPDQQRMLAAQIAHVLRPGGAYALIEVSDPDGWLMRPIYRLYLDRILPLIERLFLKGASDFSMIGAYTHAFGDCSVMAQALREAGLTVSMERHISGCATSVAGIKPVAKSAAHA